MKTGWILAALVALQLPAAQAQLGVNGAEFFSRDNLRQVLSDGYGLPSGARPASMVGGDVNGDGVDDLIIGWPSIVRFNPSPAPSVGGVTVLLGSNSGLPRRAAGQVFIEPRGQTLSGDDVGFSVALGDIGGPGPYLAVGAPGDWGGGGVPGGTVQLFPSTGSGIDEPAAGIYSQGLTGVAGADEAGDAFGHRVAFGDFNNSGFDDMLTAIPREDAGNSTDTGAFSVIYGTANGPTTDGSLIIDQDDDVPGSPEEFDRFAETIVTGNFDCDLYDDAAIGAPREDIGTDEDAGSVTVFYGSAVGFASLPLLPRRVEAWNQDSGGVTGSAEAGDRFGAALAAGDFDGDGCDDLAIGVDEEDVSSNTVADGGAVAVLYGSTSGLDAGNDQFFTENTINSPFSAETEAFFGQVLATADFNGDGYDDLAASSRGGPGRVTILFGSASGLDAQATQVWTAEALGTDCGTPLRAESLATGDWNNDGLPDLAVGVVDGLHLIYSGDTVFRDSFEQAFFPCSG